MQCAEVWRLEQATGLVTLCQVSLHRDHALQPELASLAQRLQLYVEALSRPEVADELKCACCCLSWCNQGAQIRSLLSSCAASMLRRQLWHACVGANDRYCSRTGVARASHRSRRLMACRGCMQHRCWQSLHQLYSADPALLVRRLLNSDAAAAAAAVARSTPVPAALACEVRIDWHIDPSCSPVPYLPACMHCGRDREAMRICVFTFCRPTWRIWAASCSSRHMKPAASHLC